MKYILAADDEPVNRLIIEEVLMDDYEIVCVDDGEECMEKLAEKKPDLLLLDVAMPGMDGIEVCKRIRSDENFKDLPVIMLSGFAAKENIETGMGAGADSYITKPFEPEALRNEIAKFI